MRTYQAVLVSLVALPLAVSVATPARAADTVSCSGSASVFTVDADAKLWRYGLNGPDRTPSTWSPRTQVGLGWGSFGRVLAGPGGRLYGINAQGVTRYRYFGGVWEPALKITSSWPAYATPAYRNKITVDEIGDFYLVDGAGRLLRSRYDDASSSWTAFNQVLATGWGRFDLIVAGDAGTLYARDSQGKLFRFSYDVDSQRWLEQDRLVGSGWNAFSRGMTSAGGDTLFGITASGDFRQYRFREDNGTWPVAGVKIGSGWQSFSNVTATTDTCTVKADHSPASPEVPPTADAPVSAVQLGSDFDSPGPLYFSYTGGNGSLFSGSSFPGDPSNIEWTPASGTGDYRGQPVLLADVANRTVRTFAHRSTGDLATSTAANNWTDLAGAMVATPTAVRLSDGNVAVFGVGADGSFWHRRQADGTGPFLPWTRLAGNALTGAMTAVALPERAVALLAVDSSSGALLTATYRDGALESPWVAMGSGAFVGAPGVVVLPGPRLLVLGRTAAGDIAAQLSGLDGKFAGNWQMIGDESLRGTGTPVGVIVDRTSKLMVFSRVGDTIYYFEETTSGSMIWGPGQPATAPGAGRSSPVALEYQDGMHSGWKTTAFVVRNASGGVSVWSLAFPSAAKSKNGKSAGDARFVERVPAEGR